MKVMVTLFALLLLTAACGGGGGGGGPITSPDWGFIVTEVPGQPGTWEASLWYKGAIPGDVCIASWSLPYTSGSYSTNISSTRQIVEFDQEAGWSACGSLKLVPGCLVQTNQLNVIICENQGGHTHDHPDPDPDPEDCEPHPRLHGAWTQWGPASSYGVETLLPKAARPWGRISTVAGDNEKIVQELLYGPGKYAPDWEVLRVTWTRRDYPVSTTVEQGAAGFDPETLGEIVIDVFAGVGTTLTPGTAYEDDGLTLLFDPYEWIAQGTTWWLDCTIEATCGDVFYTVIYRGIVAVDLSN